MHKHFSSFSLSFFKDMLNTWNICYVCQCEVKSVTHFRIQNMFFEKKEMLFGAETRWSIEKRNSGANLLCISLGRSSAWNHGSRELRRRPRADRCQSGNDRSLANLATRTATTKKTPPSVLCTRCERDTRGRCSRRAGFVVQ